MIKKRIQTCLVVLLLTASTVYAQFTDSTTHYIGYTSSGTFNRTNDNRSYLFNHRLKFGVRKKSVSINSDNKYLYGQLNNALMNNDFSSAWDINLYKTFPHFYYWGLLNYNSAYSLKVNNQLITGLGIAYHVVDQEALLVNLSNGIIYDYSDLKLSDSTSQVYGTFRNSFRLRVRWNVRDRLSFNGTSFIQNSLQNPEDYIFKNDLALSVKIRKWLSLTATYTFNKMTRTQTENTFLTYGITIEHYFR